jgi:nucleoside-diphosphate-sugar epimerase
MDAGVERVVVTGSLSAVGHLPDRPSDEEVPFYPFDPHLPYAHTKTLVEHECWKAAAAGLQVVVATSTAILGPNDYKPSRMGQVMCNFAHRRLPAYVPGGFTFVAARDIVEGHLLCMARGRSGQKYIFATQFLTMDEIMAMYEEITGQKRPFLRLPAEVMGPISHVTSFVKSRLFPGSPQGLTPAAVRFLRMGRKADIRKARTELGYQPTSIRRAVEEAYECFVRRGKITPVARKVTAVPAKRAQPDVEVRP